MNAIRSGDLVSLFFGSKRSTVQGLVTSVLGDRARVLWNDTGEAEWEFISQLRLEYRG